MATYIRRVIDTEIDELFGELPALLLDGAKGVGKTETALQRARTIRRLDDAGQAAIALADPSSAIAGTPPVLLDEWQRVPLIWDAVRRAVDEDRSGARFLLTGSAPFRETSVHSGAGRIASLRMRPMTLPERGVTSPTVSLGSLLTEPDASIEGASGLALLDYVDEILASGFPGLQGLAPRPRRAQLSAYVDHIVERDVEEAGFRTRRPATLRRWLQAYASATSTITSFEKIRLAAAGTSDQVPARSTTIPFVEVLTALRILEPLEAWDASGSKLRHLTRSPKHHLVDPALSAQILNLGKESLVTGKGPDGAPSGSPFLGALFESLATMSIRVFAQAREATVFYLRTASGSHEVDLVVVGPDDHVAAFEIRLGQVIEDEVVRHLKWLQGQMGSRLTNTAVISSGTDAYRRPDGVAVIPLALLGT